MYKDAIPAHLGEEESVSWQRRAKARLGKRTSRVRLWRPASFESGGRGFPCSSTLSFKRSLSNEGTLGGLADFDIAGTARGGLQFRDAPRPEVSGIQLTPEHVAVLLTRTVLDPGVGPSLEHGRRAGQKP